MQSLQNNVKEVTDAIFGISPDGQVQHFPISSGPHWLVGGTTGSGKSVFVNQLLITMMLHALPEQLKFVIVDPKKVEFTGYRDLPYMLANPIVEMDQAEKALRYLADLMDKRYAIFAKQGVKNIKEFNQLEKQAIMPYIVLVIDELSDLMGQFPEVEGHIVRLGQKARAAGIHMILATQSPRAEVVTGLIKANVPSRVALQVSGDLESRIILGEGGAEKLAGHGDMLISAGNNNGGFIRAQGAYISNQEIEAIFEHLRNRFGKPDLVASFDDDEEFGQPNPGNDHATSPILVRPKVFDKKKQDDFSDIQKMVHAVKKSTNESTNTSTKTTMATDGTSKTPVATTLTGSTRNKNSLRNKLGM